MHVTLSLCLQNLNAIYHQNLDFSDFSFYSIDVIRNVSRMVFIRKKLLSNTISIYQNSVGCDDFLKFVGWPQLINSE